MYSTLQSAALSQRPVALPFGRPSLDRLTPGIEPGPRLVTSQSRPLPGCLLRESPAEQVAWLVLALSAVGLLVLSFWI